MSDQQSVDSRLTSIFEQEHRHVPADSFVVATMQKVRARRRRQKILRVGWRMAAFVAIVAASPWLIAGVARLNAALEFSLAWTLGLPGASVLGALAVLVVLAKRVRKR